MDEYLQLSAKILALRGIGTDGTEMINSSSVPTLTGILLFCFGTVPLFYHNETGIDLEPEILI